MRTLSSLVGGLVLATTAYAAEPTLQTIADPNYPLVQENADKALKVAYIVMGDTCVGKIGRKTSSNKDMNAAEIIVLAGNQYVTIRGRDESQRDSLLLTIYKQGVSLEKVEYDYGKSEKWPTTLEDTGLDGHADYGWETPTGPFKSRTYSLAIGKWDNTYKIVKGLENEPYFQDQYIKALDAIIATCEAKQ